MVYSQGFILVPLLFKIKTLDIFFEQNPVGFAASTEDIAPCFCDSNFKVLLSTLQIYALKLLEWFSNNYIKMNSDKCHLILSSNDGNKKIELKGDFINNT